MGDKAPDNERWLPAALNEWRPAGTASLQRPINHRRSAPACVRPSSTPPPPTSWTERGFPPTPMWSINNGFMGASSGRFSDTPRTKGEGDPSEPSAGLPNGLWVQLPQLLIRAGGARYINKCACVDIYLLNSWPYRRSLRCVSLCCEALAAPAAEQAPQKAAAPNF